MKPGGAHTSWCLQVSLSPWAQKTCSVISCAWLGWTYRCPIHCIPGSALSCLYRPLFAVLNFSTSTFGQQILQLQLSSDEESEEEETYLPELCKYSQGTHTRPQYSLKPRAKPFVNTRLRSNCALLGLRSKWLHRVRNLQGLQSQTWTFTVHIHRTYSTGS